LVSSSEQPRDLHRRLAVTTGWGAPAARFKLLGDGSESF